jgi:hypothetical protein
MLFCGAPFICACLTLNTFMNKTALLAAVMAAFVLAACGKKEEAPVAPVAAPAPAAVTEEPADVADEEGELLDEEAPETEGADAEATESETSESTPPASAN